MLRFLTAGESHGQGLSAIIEGLPAGLAISEEDINSLLERRQCCYGRGARMKKIEKDRARIISGVRHGVTIGSPLALYIENKDWAARRSTASKSGHIPRPGHADLAGVTKYRFGDIQDVIERASARETAIRTAVGAVAKRFLAEFGIEIIGHVVAIGGKFSRRRKLTVPQIRHAISTSPVYCADPMAARAMCRQIDRARQDGDTLGGVFEVVLADAPVGLGSYVHWDRKIDGRLAQAVLSIPSVKGMEFGAAIRNAGRPGSMVHDEITISGENVVRMSNRAGGLEGGVTNGEHIVIRGFAKPISSLRTPLRSVNLRSKKATRAPYVRSDVCVVPAISVIAEAMVAWVIAECFVEKFGGDSMSEIRDNHTRAVHHIHG